MSLEYNEKGKLFTEVVTKVPVAALIQTTAQLVRGKIHVRPDERLKDGLDREEPYIAVTEASILGDDRMPSYSTDFLAIRRDKIVWVMPDETKKGGHEK